MPGLAWHPAEIAFWIAAASVFFLLPSHLVLASQVLIAGLFALSLDLILGYAGIVSLGHAAFFGAGAYTVGLLARYGWGEPITGLIAAGVVAMLLGYLTSHLIVRGSDLTRLMVTLGIGVMLFEAANKARSITGGVDGLSDMVVWKLFGRFSFDLEGKTAFLYSLALAFLCFWLARRIVSSPFGLTLRGIREGAARMPAIGAPVRRRLIAIYTIAAAFAGVAGGLLAETTQFVGLDVLSFSRSAELLIMLVLGGVGHLYGALIGAALFMVARDILANMNPVYWQFWLGLLLVLTVLFARGGVMGGIVALRGRLGLGEPWRPR